MADSTDLRRLEIAFNNCVRFVYGLRRYSGNILGCSLAKYYEFRACLHGSLKQLLGPLICLISMKIFYSTLHGGDLKIYWFVSHHGLDSFILNHYISKAWKKNQNLGFNTFTSKFYCLKKQKHFFFII
jgi:hypothetical protein